MADYPSNGPSHYSGYKSLYQAQLQPTPNDDEATARVAANENGDGSYVPRPKRIACVVCRRRKLKCDGKKPSCGTCSRLGHQCTYDEVRKKSGPKRGYVKQLETRLAQVEKLLDGQEPATLSVPQIQPQPPENAFVPIQNDMDPTGISNTPTLGADMGHVIPPTDVTGQPQPNQEYIPEASFNAMDHSTWDMLSLGLEEPLPAQGVIDELNHIYFEKIQPSIPMLHRPKYLAASNLAPTLRPPIYLQYSMWIHAAAVSDKYHHLHDHFYRRVRKYAELEEMKGLGESILSLAYCQTWLLISIHESRNLYFPRAWLSTGKCARLALMLGLNRLDGAGPNVKQSLPPPEDWAEKEERRRTFWIAFCCDRYSSIGTSWPMQIDERDIMTDLPSTEESFIKSYPQQMLPLADILAGEGTSTLSPFGCVVVLAALFGRNLTHLHRPDPQDNEHDLNGEFWKRHRSYDNILLHIALQLPNHLRLPAGMGDMNIIFSNMCIHTSTICLHQVAIFKAEKNKLPEQMITESKRRCIVAADQISNIMKLISHTDLTRVHPFMPFCVYVAARVFVQYLKSRPDDSMVQSSLQFVVSALKALKNKNPLTETFLVQLDVDTEGRVFQGAQTPAKRGRFETNLTSQVTTCVSDGCPPFLGLPDPNEVADVSRPGTGIDSGINQYQFNNHPTTTPLPERYKQAQPNMNTGDVMQVFTASHNHNPEIGAAASGSMTDMELALNPFLNHRNYPSSDDPMSSTPTSTISYSRPNHPQQQSSTATIQNPLNTLNMSSANNGGTNPETSWTTPQFSIPSPSPWDFPTMPQMPVNNSPGTNTGSEPMGFNQTELGQLLNSNNWVAWRH